MEAVKCKLFACVHAMRGGCSIEGYMDPTSQNYPKKEICPIYNACCIRVACSYCRRDGDKTCPKEGAEE